MFLALILFMLKSSVDMLSNYEINIWKRYRIQNFNQNMPSFEDKYYSPRALKAAYTKKKVI